ncbi:MAG: sulfur carrier protein ThiS [Vicinamibacteria bacterium]
MSAGGFEVHVNGESVSVSAGSTIADLLGRLSLDPRRVAVEVNLEVVPRAQHSARRLSPGDRLEIVTFVGGGAC